MPKFFVVFTEESTRDHGYYVDAKNREDAYNQAQGKYYAMQEADSINTSYSKTIDHEVQNA